MKGDAVAGKRRWFSLKWLLLFALGWLVLLQVGSYLLWADQRYVESLDPYVFEALGVKKGVIPPEKSLNWGHCILENNTHNYSENTDMYFSHFEKLMQKYSKYPDNLDTDTDGMSLMQIFDYAVQIDLTNRPGTDTVFIGFHKGADAPFRRRTQIELNSGDSVVYEQFWILGKWYTTQEVYLGVPNQGTVAPSKP